jgi:hypothetical protein
MSNSFDDNFISLGISCEGRPSNIMRSHEVNILPS